MKNKIALILAVFCGSFAFAQTNKLPVEIVLGKLTEEDDDTEAGAFVGYDGEHYILKEYDWDIFSLNNDFKYEREGDLVFKYDKRSVTEDRYFFVEHSLYMIYHIRDKKVDQTKFFAQEISVTSMEQIGPPVSLFNTTDDLDAIEVIISDDNSFAAFFTQPDVDKDEDIYFEVAVVDRELSPKWQKKVKLPYAKEDMYVTDYKISNNGDVFVVCQLDFEKKDKDLPDYEIKIFAVSEDSNEATEFTASLGNQFITDLSIDVASNGDLVCAGYYSDEGDYSIKGCYYLRVDPSTGEEISENKKAFDEDLINEMLSKKQIKKGEDELYSYYLDHIEVRKDGNTILMGEKYYVTTYQSSYYSNGTWHTTTNYVYHYDHIIVSMVDAEGYIIWSKIIPKYSTSERYAYAFDSEGVYIFYNDSDINLEAEDKEEVENKYKGNAISTMAMINNEGELEKYNLFINPEELHLSINASKMLSEEKFFFYAMDSKHFQAGYILLKP